MPQRILFAEIKAASERSGRIASVWLREPKQRHKFRSAIPVVLPSRHQREGVRLSALKLNKYGHFH